MIASYFLFTLLDGAVKLPQLSQNMGYGLLFAVGLLTGFHCVAMCGGFVMSYTAKAAQERKPSYRSHIMYGIGKTASYTIIGAVFGLVGSIIAFTPTMRGVVGIISGIFLLLFGLKMLNIFPSLRRLSIAPTSLDKFVGKESSTQTSPMVIGLLNGLMIACGPLQAVYVMAAGTGSMLEGAKLLFIFALGTLPVMLGFGYITSFISSKMTHKILKASGVIVLILGLFMINNGLALTGTGYDVGSIVSTARANVVSAAPPAKGAQNNNVALISEGFQEIHMDATASGYSPNMFVLKKGVPVKWIINGKEITGCNKEIQVPKLGLTIDLKEGEQTINFTPTESGTISWSCWMGMLHGTFIVQDDISDTAATQKAAASAPTPKGGSCGGSGSGCGCGMM
jgi:sulfite exporter TauE/SafE